MQNNLGLHNILLRIIKLIRFYDPGCDESTDDETEISRKKQFRKYKKGSRPELLSAPKTTIRTPKKDNNKQPLNWLKIRCLRFERESPLIINFRETLNVIYPFREIDLKKKPVAVRHATSLASVAQTCLYPSRRAMN